jgi:hypothetical protein
MSTLMVSAGSARSSAQVHELAVTPPRVMENVQSASGVRGVGPAANTGKSLVTCWPGGTRPASPAGAGCRRWKPRETGLMTVRFSLRP